MRRALATTLLTASLLAVTTARADVIFHDSTFNSTDWSLMTTGTDATHTITLSKIASGGNPDSYQQMEFNLGSNSATGVAGIALYTAQTYNPATLGAITSIDFSEDHKQSADLVGAMILLQNGTLYTSQPNPYFSGNNNWTNYSFTGFTSNSFGSASSRPDFSASGGSITFGYYLARYSPPGILDGGIDNWSTTLHTTAAAVPEPSMLALAGTGTALTLACGWFRRRRGPRREV